MIQIEDVVVSFDVLREKFLCNLDACKGECCIEGDAGLPVELDEVEKPGRGSADNMGRACRRKHVLSLRSKEWYTRIRKVIW